MRVERFEVHGRSLNDAAPEFAPGGRIPTCEELARLIADRVNVALSDAGFAARVSFLSLEHPYCFAGRVSPSSGSRADQAGRLVGNLVAI